MYLVTIQRESYDNHPFYGENYDYGYRQIATFDFFLKALQFVHSEKARYKEEVFNHFDDVPCFELVLPNKGNIVYSMVLMDDFEDTFVDFTIREVEDGTVITVGDDTYV